MSMGNIKAIIKTDSVTALEPHLPGMRLHVVVASTGFIKEYSVVSGWLHEIGDFLSKYGVSSEQSFQLFCLEDILR